MKYNGSGTIHSFLFSLDSKGRFIPDKGFKRAVYLIDECSMIHSYLLNTVMKKAENNNSKIIFLGDNYQLQPVGDDPKLFTW